MGISSSRDGCREKVIGIVFRHYRGERGGVMIRTDGGRILNFQPLARIRLCP